MKAIVAFSGGMDSATVAAEAIAQDLEVELVGFYYGSKHNDWENIAAEQLAKHWGVPFQLIDLSSVMAEFKSNLLKSGGEIPEGHYEAENMRQTVVPGRNLIFASILTGIAWSREASEVWMGIHAGDHFIYPDCRPSFFKAMGNAMLEGSDGKIALVAPFLNVTKVEIIKRGQELNVPYQLTRTCYKNQRIACGRCGSCQERLAAFAANGLVDPVEYETRELIQR